MLCINLLPGIFDFMQRRLSYGHLDAAMFVSVWSGAIAAGVLLTSAFERGWIAAARCHPVDQL
jgi:hypothetical protein